MKLGNEALQVARGQLGQSEDPKGSNSGPMVDEYLRSVGLDPGFAWCAAFVYWCFEQATTNAGMQNPVPRTAGVLDLWKKSTNRFDSPRPGDIFIMDYGQGKGHTGIVERVLLDGLIETIEGNTNDEGSREGYEVARRKRPMAKVLGYLRF
jgi:hypothetical protein